VVNKACTIFELCQSNGTGDQDEDLPLLFTLLHLIEMGDAVEILLSASSVHPAKLQLRSMLEASLTIEYILRADSKRRSFAWLVTRAHRHISIYESMSPNTNSGRDLRRLLSDDDIQMNLDALPQKDLDGAIDNLRNLLKNPNYAEGDAEYRRVRQKRANPEWYSLYGGPVTIRELSVRLNKLGSYQFLYKTWSEIMHGGDAGRYLTRTSSGKAAINALRNPKDLLQVAHLAISFLLDPMRLLVLKFARNESLKRWYIDEIQEGYRRLTTIKINVVERDILGK
jgi:hypothetical protein